MTSDYLRRPGCVLHFSVVEETRRDVAHDHTASGGRACVAPKPIFLHGASPSGLETINSPSSDKKGFSHDPVKLPRPNYPGHSHNNKAAIVIDNNG